MLVFKVMGIFIKYYFSKAKSQVSVLMTNGPLVLSLDVEPFSTTMVMLTSILF